MQDIDRALKWSLVKCGPIPLKVLANICQKINIEMLIPCQTELQSNMVVPVATSWHWACNIEIQY